MTKSLAADLAHLVGEGIVPTPGVVHDPLSPLVLGDEGTGIYCVQTFNAGTNRWQLQVFGPSAASATLTMDHLGNILVNGTALGSLPSMAAAVTAAQAAATAAIAAKVAAEGAATNANTSATAAAASETNAATYRDTANEALAAAQAAATLSQQYATADATVSLPGGGVSSRVSAELAAALAISSRDMPVNASQSGNKTFDATWLYGITPFTGTALQTVTVNANTYRNAAAKRGYALLQNTGAGGSIKVVGAAAALDLQPATIVAQGTIVKRRKGVTPPQTFLVDMAMPAITNGKVFINVWAGFDAAAQPLTFSATLNSGLTFNAALTAFPSTAPTAYEPNLGQYEAPIVGAGARTVRATIVISANIDWAVIDWWAVEGTNGGAAVPFSALAATPPANSVSKSTTSLGNQTLVLVSAVQRGAVGGAVFSNFSGGPTLRQTANGSGIDDATVPDSNGGRNVTFARGDMLLSAAGVVTPAANWANSINQPGIALIAIPPVSSIGAGAVVMHYENGQDTVTQANGIIELSFDPNGLDIYTRMSS